MATSKKPAAKAAKKATPAKKVSKAAAKPAVKASAKAVAKKPVKAVAKVQAKSSAKAAPKATVAVFKPAAKLHAVPSKRGNAPTPDWMDKAVKYAQQNPAVSLVSLIVGALGLMLIFG